MMICVSRTGGRVSLDRDRRRVPPASIPARNSASVSPSVSWKAAGGVPGLAEILVEPAGDDVLAGDVRLQELVLGVEPLQQSPRAPRRARPSASAARPLGPRRALSSAARIACRASIAASRPSSARSCPPRLAGLAAAPAASRAVATAKRAPITACVRARPPRARRGAPRPRRGAAGAARSERRPSGPGRRHEVGAFTQTASAPSAACSAPRAPRPARRAGAVEAPPRSPAHPEGVVEGLDAPDRPGDQPAEGAERLGLAAEPARVADHLVADEPGRDQVGERRRAAGRRRDAGEAGAATAGRAMRGSSWRSPPTSDLP